MAIVLPTSLQMLVAAILQTHLPQFAEQVRFVPADFPLRVLSWWLRPDRRRGLALPSQARTQHR